MDNGDATTVLANEPVDDPISHNSFAISPTTITGPLSGLAISPSLVASISSAPPLPTEIIIEILTQLNRQALINARCINKQFCLVATDLLFDKLSLRYGIDHSVPQMTAMITSPLRFRVTSLFIPTESFFSCELSSSGVFGWTRVPFWRKVWWGGNGHYHGGFPVHYREFPKPSFSLHQQYKDALLGLLDACVNLESIHIAVSDFFQGNREPMKEWMLFMGQKVLPKMATLRITNLKMSFPSTQKLAQLVNLYEGTKGSTQQEGTSRPPVFTESLKLISCIINIPRMPEIEILHRPKISSSEFESGNIDPGGTSWADIFSIISVALPKLSYFNFQRLMYGPFLTYKRLGLLVPYGGKYWKIKLSRFNRISPADHDELISPYERDHLALGQLRKTVAGRNGYPVRGIAFLDTEEENVAHEWLAVNPYPVWTIL
ncbi:hypothetical protein TWF730_010337 [Orbilia blumenaviensis]|uniref:F-box domain-containing protein n=1 Tax=Orbilia blumenaviensis TaxID=1796055 RepID=A0AAV9UPI0_9PEZI